jgi:hypothetical protein
MRPVGPRILATQPTTDTAVILDWYNKGDTTPVVMADETAIGTLTYVVEIMMSNPFEPTPAPVWASAGAGTAAAPGRYFSLPPNATAVRVRTTGGAGSVTYWVTQPGLGG